MNKSFAILCLVSLLLSSCKKESPSSSTLRVEYEIECTDCFVVCYDENGNQKAWYHQNSSFRYGFDGKKGDITLLVAQNTGSNAATVTGRIKVNGTTSKTGSSYCPIQGTVVVTDTLK